jgi:hypothetical protein
MRRLVFLCAALASAHLPVAAAESPTTGAADAALEHLRKGDCRGLLEPLNKGLQAREAKAFFVLGALYLKGACVDKDVARGLQQLELAARAGEIQAAEQLVLIHGLGRDVPQDYTRAGVWAVALTDLHRARTALAPPPGDARATVVQLPGGTLDPVWTKAFGQAMTIHELAREKVLRNRVESRYELRVDVQVIVTSAGPDGKATVAFEEAMHDRATPTGSNLSKPLGGEIVRDIRAIFEEALREVPPLDSPVAVQAQRVFVVTVR